MAHKLPTARPAPTPLAARLPVPTARPATAPPPAIGPARMFRAPRRHSPRSGRRSRKLVAAVAVALVLIGGGAGTGIAYLYRPNQGSAAGLAASPSGHTLTTSQIAAKVDPAVVDIVTNLGEGTGMIVSSNGEIITNNHVVDGATSIKVAVVDRGTYSATVVGTDATADVAVLKLKGVSGLATVKFANSSSVVVGDSVVAIGNAGGQGFPSAVTAGAVTALNRTIRASNDSGGSETLTGMIQMDALIEPGNSGGPLVDSSGYVIGMDTAAASADGATPIGFALPINRVEKIADEIEQGKAGNGIVIGTVAFLGIYGQAVSTGSGATGVSLVIVDPGTPAAEAGLQPGDVIVAFDGHATSTLSELATLIHKRAPRRPCHDHLRQPCRRLPRPSRRHSPRRRPPEVRRSRRRINSGAPLTRPRSSGISAGPRVRPGARAVVQPGEHHCHEAAPASAHLRRERPARARRLCPEGASGHGHLTRFGPESPSPAALESPAPHRCSSSSSSAVSAPPQSLGPCGGSVGSSTVKVAPPPGSLGENDAPAVGVRDGGHDREPQSGTALGTDPAGVRAPEALEHVRGRIGRDPGPVVDHADPRPAGRGILRWPSRRRRSRPGCPPGV